MERIESHAEFSDLINKYKKEQGALQSNCLFLPSEVDEMIRKNKLYIDRSGLGLCFYVQEEACSRLYYYLPEKILPVAARREKPVLLDCVFRGGEPEALEKAGCDKWMEAGFEPYKRYRRMECSGMQFHPPKDYRACETGFRVSRLSPGDFSEVTKLWRDSLDIYSTFLPDEADYAAACERGEIMGVRLANGIPGAVNRAIKKGRTSFLQHLAVSPELRGKGMGKTLFYATVDFVLAEYKADKVNFWVDEENSRAIGMYQKAGFVDDGMVSRQFILR